ncbi:Uncharacterised protein [Burkholderia pseudomallei]|nr:Uncharacterised protein [Burkholderia pseudomallei]
MRAVNLQRDREQRLPAAVAPALRDAVRAARIGVEIGFEHRPEDLLPQRIVAQRVGDEQEAVGGGVDRRLLEERCAPHDGEPLHPAARGPCAQRPAQQFGGGRAAVAQPAERDGQLARVRDDRGGDRLARGEVGGVVSRERFLGARVAPGPFDRDDVEPVGRRARPAVETAAAAARIREAVQLHARPAARLQPHEPARRGRRRRGDALHAAARSRFGRACALACAFARTRVRRRRTRGGRFVRCIGERGARAVGIGRVRVIGRRRGGIGFGIGLRRVDIDRRPRPRPVAVALERIAGQRHARERAAGRGRFVRVIRAPVDRHARAPQLADRVAEMSGVVRVVARGGQRRQHARRERRRVRARVPVWARGRAGVRSAREMLADQAAQHGARADFEHDVGLPAQQRGNVVRPAHRLEQMARPVAGRGGVGAQPAARHVAGHRNARRGARDALRDDRVGDGLHQRRMERMRHRHRPAPATERGERARGVGERGLRAGEHERARRVAHRDPHVGAPGRPLLDARVVARHGEHAATRGRAAAGGERIQRFGRAGARRDERGRLLERERLGGDGGRILADAVPRDGDGPHAVLAEHRRERVLEREQPALRDERAAHRLVVGVQDRMGDRRAERAFERRARGVEVMAEAAGLRVRAIQLARHARMLRALAGEAERDGRAGLGANGGGRRVGHVRHVDARFGERGGACAQRGGRVGRPRGHRERDAQRMRFARDVQRMGGAAEIGRVQRRETFGERLQVARERARRARGHGHQVMRARHALGGRGGTRGRGRFLDDHVRVRAADPEARHARAPRQLRRRIGDGPVVGVTLHDERRRIVLDERHELRVERVEMHGRHALPMPQLQHRLDEARDAGRAVRVTDVAFHAADRAAARDGGGVGIGAARLRERVGEALQLDRVADQRRGRVALDVRDLLGAYVGHVERVDDAAPLRVRVRRGVARLHPAVVRQPDARDHREDRIAVRFGEVEPLEHDRADRVAEQRAARARVERTHVAVGAADEAVLVAEAEVRERQRGRTRDRHLALAGANRLHRLHDRDERAAACGADGHRGPAEIELIRDARRDVVLLVADLGEHQPARIERREQPAALQVMDEIAVDPAAREHARARAIAVLGARVARLLERAPRDFHEEPVLRIHQHRFAPADAEEERIELVRVADDLRGRHPVGMVELCGVDALREQLLAREARQAVDALRQVAPERIDRIGAREASRHADDRDLRRARARSRACRARIAGVVRAPARGVFLARAAAVVGEVPQPAVLIQIDDGEREPEPLAERADRFRRAQRIAAELEEVVVARDRRDAEHIAPDLREPRFEPVARGGRHGAALGGRGARRRFGRRQRPPVELARGARAQRERLQADEVRGHRVFGQLRARLLAQPRERRLRRRAAAPDDIGGERRRLFRVRIVDRHDERLADAVDRIEHVLDRVQQHLEAADLHGVVDAAEDRDLAVGQQPRAVARPIGGRVVAALGERGHRRQEFLGGARRVVEIAGPEGGRRDVQLACFARRHRAPRFVEHRERAAGQRPADRHAPAVVARARRQQIRVADVEAFPRAVRVDEPHRWRERRARLVDDALRHDFAHQEPCGHVRERIAQLPGDAGEVEHAFEQRRRDDEPRDPLAPQQRDEPGRIEDHVVADHDGRAAEHQRAQAFPGEKHVEPFALAVGVRIQRVARVEAVARADVRREDGLRLARRAARQRDERDVVGARRDARPCALRERRPRADERAARIGQVFGRAREQRGRRRELRDAAARDEFADERIGPAFLEQAHRRADRPRADDRQHVFGAVRQEHADHILPADARRAKRVGELGRMRRELPVGPRALAVLQRERVRRARDVFANRGEHRLRIAPIAGRAQARGDARARIGRRRDDRRGALREPLLDVAGEARTQRRAGRRVEKIEVMAVERFDRARVLRRNVRAPRTQIVDARARIGRAAVDRAWRAQRVAACVPVGLGEPKVRSQRGENVAGDVGVVERAFREEAPAPHGLDEFGVGQRMRLSTPRGRGAFARRRGMARQKDAGRPRAAALLERARDFVGEQRAEAVAEQEEGRAVVEPRDLGGEIVDERRPVVVERNVLGRAATGQAECRESERVAEFAGDVRIAGAAAARERKRDDPRPTIERSVAR